MVFFSVNALWKNKIAVLVGDFLLAKGLMLSVNNDDFNLLKIVSEAVKSPLMIHLPSMEINGSHEMISYHLSELKNIENRLAAFYSDVTELDKDTIYSLLQNETFLSPQESLELGFATQIQAAPKPHQK